MSYRSAAIDIAERGRNGHNIKHSVFIWPRILYLIKILCQIRHNISLCRFTGTVCCSAGDIVVFIRVIKRRMILYIPPLSTAVRRCTIHRDN